MTNVNVAYSECAVDNFEADFAAVALSMDLSLESRRELYRAATATWDKNGTTYSVSSKYAADLVTDVCGGDMYDVLWSGNEGEVSPRLVDAFSSKGWVKV